MIMDASMVAAASAAAAFANGHRGHVFLVGQDLPALDAMRHLLAQQGYRVYAFMDLKVFLNFVTPVSPAVLLLDMALPGASGTQVQDRLQSLGIHMPVILVTQETGAGAQVPEGTPAPAQANSDRLQFLARPVARLELLRAVSQGISADTPAPSPQVPPSTPQDRLARLSPREREVMALLARGQTNTDVAQTLGISTATATRHKNSILLKLDLHSVQALQALLQG